MSPTPEIYTFYEPVTGTWQYIAIDPNSREAVIIDSVLDFDPATSKISTKSADRLLTFVAQNNCMVTHILETHVHADHLTASHYIQQQLIKQNGRRSQICTGKRIKEVQSRFAKRYDIDPSELSDVYDRLFDDNEAFSLGGIQCKVLYLPGHTPDHVGYMIGENVFTGDSIFNPDVGTARCDFPGGSAAQLYRSIEVLLSLPPHYRLYTGHDYPPDSREPSATGTKEVPFTTVAEQRASNKHVKDGVEKESFVKWRSERDQSLSEPRLLHQAIQLNIRGGRLPAATVDAFTFLKIPLKVPESYSED